MSPTNGFVRAASLADLQEHGKMAVRVADRTLLLLSHEGRVHAIDNRCPHMGFPLERGTVRDGILTCNWHYARFELCSGGTFDLFADDVRVYPVEIRGDEVWVDPHPQRDEAAYQQKRLSDGLEQNISLVLAKSAINLLEHDVSPMEVLRIGGLFGAERRQGGWRDGLTILTAMGRILPALDRPDRPLALYHGLLHVANNVDGQPPHDLLDALDIDGLSLERTRAWLREFAEVRDRDGVERLVLTAVQAGAGPAALADMLTAAVTDHYHVDNGHSLDFINKAFELLDLIGWEHAAPILASVVPAITGADRMEEDSAWRTPVDLVAIHTPVFSDLLAGRLIDDPGRAGELSEEGFDRLVEIVLGDDAEVIALALAEALQAGAGLAQLALAVSYAAAVRVARFHTSNEFTDWIAVLHAFTAANAARQLLLRAPSLEGGRAIWYGAMHVYLNRFLNAPSARQPTVDSVAGISGDPETLLQELLALGDQRQRVEQAAAAAYRYLSLGAPPDRLIASLAELLLREDGEFHSYQMLEAGVRLHTELSTLRPDLAPTALIAVARYLAGHAPTDRATTQTYHIAKRLSAGEGVEEQPA